MKSDLRLRLAVAGVGVPACAAVVYLGGAAFAAGLGLVAATAYWEYASMQREGEPAAFLVPGCLAAGAFPLVVLYFGFTGAWVFGAGVLMAFGAWGMARVPVEERPISAAAVSSFGALYVGGLVAFGVPLREGVVPGTGLGLAAAAPGRLVATLFFFYPVVVTWLADTAAYFGGRAFGRRRLAARVSPNKTVEGAAAALIVGPLAALAYGWAALPAGLRPGAGGALAFGLLVAGAAILGDLVESALKREKRVKDASGLLPGHGGLLDRLDSILWALPAAYFFFEVLR